MISGPVTAALRRHWPRVDPCEVVAVLQAWSASAPEAAAALLADALACSGPGVADHLMAPIAARFEPSTRDDARIEVLHALEALTRAGGDPSAVLGVAAGALRGRRTRRSAARMLRRAGLRGWSLAALDLPEPAGSLSARQVHRLARLQRSGQEAAVRTLGAVYDRQPIGNLSDGIALVEVQLLSAVGEEAAEAQQVLAGLEAAGADLYRCWRALLPVLTRQLRGGPWRAEAARALGQLRHARSGAGLSEEAAIEDAAPHLSAATLHLSEALSAPAAIAQSAAQTLRIFGELGLPLDAARPALEQALSARSAAVRSHSSRALSAWLERSGQEAPLPRGCSRRRIFAASDKPLPGERPLRCPACASEGALVLYRHEDISQTHADIMVELRCPDCGLYSEQHWGY